MLLSAAVVFIGPQVGAPPLGAVPFDVPGWAFIPLFYLAEVTVLHFRLRQNTHSFSMSEFPLVLGLYLIEPTALVAAVLMGSATALVVNRRQPLIKLGFNLSQLALQVAIASQVFRSLVADSEPLGARGALAVMAAVTCTYLISTIAITVAIWLSGGTIEPRERLHVLAMSGVAGIFNAALGLTAVTIVISRPASAWLAVVPPVVLFFAYRAYIQQRQESSRLQNLYVASQELHRLPDIEQAARAAVARIHEIFDVDEVELLLLADGRSFPGMSVRWSSTEAGLTVSGLDPDHPTLEELETNAHAQMLRRQRPGGRNRIVPQVVGMTAPVTSRGEVYGILKVENPVSDIASFGNADMRLLQTLAGNIAVSIENARLGHSIARLTELKDELHHEARHDTLTGLANRTQLIERANRLATTDRDTVAAVMFVDLDDFKSINDTHGHDAGDRMLIHVADVLTRSCRPTDTVARVGGDEFVILLEGLAAVDQSEIVAKRITRALAEPVNIAGVDLVAKASVGIAEFDSDLDPLVALQAADQAMYQAKQHGGGGHVLAADTDPHMAEQQPITREELRHALDAGEFVLEYQPITDLASGQVTHLEALIRWDSPTRGRVCPDSFISVAENTGLIHSIDMWVVGEASRMLRRVFLDAGHVAPRVSVNLSATELDSDSLFDDVMRSLDAAAVPPAHLQLEITEDAVVDGELSQLRRLRDTGVTVALDDFGTGYSSLAYLDLLPIDTVKIDRSFISRIADAKAEALVRMVIGVADELGFDTVCEGVETLEQLLTVRALGCGAIQGHLVAASLRESVLMKTLEEIHRANPTGALLSAV